MASLRKDSAVGRAAAARRRQRVDKGVDFATSPKTAELLERSSHVASEAASILASVRSPAKTVSPAPPVVSSVPSSISSPHTVTSVSSLRQTTVRTDQSLLQNSIREAPLPSATPPRPHSVSKSDMDDDGSESQDELMEEFPPTVEDIEKIITDPFIDASCIPNQSPIRLFSHSRGLIDTTVTLQILQSNEMPNHPKVLCYGDRVVFNEPDGGSTFPQQHWTVLRALSDTAILLKDQACRGPAGPVRVGDPVVFRSRKGGVLKGDLELLTNSYSTKQVRHDENQYTTLLGRLQRHNRLVPSNHETFHVVMASAPPVPIWATQASIRSGIRPYLEGSLAYLNEEIDATAGESETQLIDELLGSFFGLQGGFLQTKRDDKEASFVYRGSDEVLRQLVEMMLPLSGAMVRVRQFVTVHLMGYEFGRVMHALSAQLDLMLQELMEKLSSVADNAQNREMSLCRIQLEVESIQHLVIILDDVCKTVAPYRGGALLNALNNLKANSYQGDTASRVVFEKLLEAASVPYFKLLGDWLQKGLLDDPYYEFMVNYMGEEAPWESRYEIVPEHVLEDFFPTDVAVKQLLDTGRYWNALRYGPKNRKSASPFDGQPVSFSDAGNTVAQIVQINHENASRVLKELLVDMGDLQGSLSIMKRYFLISNGDFFVHFLDAAEEELRKDVTELSKGRVQHWLDSSIQLTEQNDDLWTRDALKRADQKYKLTPGALRCRFASISLVDQLDDLHSSTGGLATHEPWTPLRHTYSGMKRGALTGLEAITLNLEEIPFPLSLIVTQTSLDCYQLLFRHFFFAKHTERRLVTIWNDHQNLKELPSLRRLMGSTFLLRQRMLHFVQNLIYYMMLEVIEPLWSKMEAAIAKCFENGKTVDDILHAHMNFLQQSLDACLLTNRNQLKSLTKLMSTCLLFSDQMKLFTEATKIDEDRAVVASEKRRDVHRALNQLPSSDKKTASVKQARRERAERIQRQTTRVERELSGESYSRMINRFDQVFSDNLRDFMTYLAHSDDLYHTQKVNLCIRLDYNGYITQTMGIQE